MIRNALQGLINEWNATDQPLQQRGTILPLGIYEDGSAHLAWPGLIMDGIEGWGNLQDSAAAARENPSLMFDEDFNRQAAGDSFLAAGLAATGGLAAGAASVPENSLGMFAGRMAKTADQNALARAEQMASQGAPREQIWNDTGWFKGVDDKWRFEIDDFNANLKGTTKDYADSGESMPLSDFYNHADLYSAYPHLGDTRFAVTSQFKPGEGFYGTQTVDGKVREIIAAGYSGNRVGQSDLGAVDVLPHELQHAIQSAEQFAQGGNLGKMDKAIRQRLIDEKMRVMAPIAEAQGIPLDAMRKVVAKEIDGPAGKNDAYRRLAGEVEARTAAKRQSLMADERRARPPWLDYDVPESDQIVRFGSDGPQMSAAGAVPDNALASNAIRQGGDRAPAAVNALEKGQGPIRAYHGTRARDFEAFNPDQFFSPLPQVASDYAVGMAGDIGGNPRVIPVDLRIENPAVVPSEIMGRPSWVGDAKRLIGADPKSDLSFQDAARELGFDSVVYRGSGYGLHGADEYQALRPGTVFSATTGEQLFSNPRTAPLAPAAINALEDQAPKGIRAYHGSPHDFDRFSLDKIGTGEGAQAYGHGLYFSEEEAVAKNYRDRLSRKAFNLDGNRLPMDHYLFDAGYRFGDAESTDDALRRMAAERRREAEYKSKLPETSLGRRSVPALLKEADELESMVGRLTENKGRMYKVRINADPDQFLDLDAPVSAIPETHRQALEQIGSYPKTLEHTKALREAGIPGIRYLDGQSRGAGQGSRNYVVFDENLIDIIEKYANPWTSAPLGLAPSAFDDNPRNRLARSLLETY